MIGRFPWDPFPPDTPDPKGPDPIHAVAYRGAVTAADAYRGVRSALRTEGELLRVGNRFVSVTRYREIAFLALGHAANSMAFAAMRALGERLTQGFLAGPDPAPEIPFSSEMLREGAPAGPDTERATASALELAAGLGKGDLLLVLLSSGAVRALARPPPGLSDSDWAAWLEELGRRGASGREVELVVRALGSGGVAGRLGRAVREAEVDTLLVDRGHGARRLGGGPTVGLRPEERTEARAILERVGLANRLSGPLAERLRPDPSQSSGVGSDVERPVVVAGPGDGLRGAADAVFDKRWTSRLVAVDLPLPPREAADHFLERTEELLRSRDARPVGSSHGVALFAGTTLGVPEGQDEGPALAEFLRSAQTGLKRREMSVGLFRTSGGVGDPAYPPGAVVGTPGRPEVAASVDRPRGLRMRAGVTDVGALIVALWPGAPGG